MHLHHVGLFLKVGKDQVPHGKFRAVAIHPSSEVDVVQIGDGGPILSPGSIVPVKGGEQVLALRHRPNLGAGALLEGDDVGQKLVLQCYEDCDAMVPPLDRVPVIRNVTVPAAQVGAAAGTATFALRLPFQGRSHAVIRFWRTTAAADLSLGIVGVSYGDRRLNAGLGNSNFHGAMTPNPTVYTWWNGGGAAPTVGFSVLLAGNRSWRTVFVENENYDELALFVFGAAGGDAQIEAKAYGEEVRPDV